LIHKIRSPALDRESHLSQVIFVLACLPVVQRESKQI
jgi:hypothetical protein